MNTTTIKNTLKAYSLRQTECREEILDIFLTKAYALAHADVETQMSEKFDRVTVYRTLKTFLDKGLIHKVLDDEGGIKYALCKDDCHTSDHKHHHDHVHFKCTNCGLTTCLDHVVIPTIALPEGYKRQETNLLVQGVCKDCSKTA
ncbi:Fur family transcriptional regulator [Flectobacillus major]|jgi:Fur family ferric uptake transcriptional regulator|uniref:Fur family transcriptional regulator n=1 Tax=Flectobacillus major TaxID=103 RepID=UPI000419D82A|nr:transcriptional repressor [Flectobacillus major]